MFDTNSSIKLHPGKNRRVCVKDSLANNNFIIYSKFTGGKKLFAIVCVCVWVYTKKYFETNLNLDGSVFRAVMPTSVPGNIPMAVCRRKCSGKSEFLRVLFFAHD